MADIPVTTSISPSCMQFITQNPPFHMEKKNLWFLYRTRLFPPSTPPAPPLFFTSIKWFASWVFSGPQISPPFWIFESWEERIERASASLFFCSLITVVTVKCLCFYFGVHFRKKTVASWIWDTLAEECTYPKGWYCSIQTNLTNK